MRHRTLGEVSVGAIGLGAMPLSIEGRPDEARALATVHAALDAGVTLLDTADSYHLPGAEPGHHERLRVAAEAHGAHDAADHRAEEDERHAGPEADGLGHHHEGEEAHERHGEEEIRKIYDSSSAQRA